MGAKIFIGLLIGFISSFAFDRIKETRNRRTASPEEQVEPQQIRWKLLLLSVIPGFFLGAVIAGIMEGADMVEDIAAFSTGFYVLISIGSIISYVVLDRFFPGKG